MSYSETLAKFVSELSYESLPQSVIKRAKELMIDCIGVAFAGSKEQSAKNVISALKSMPNTKGNIKLWANDERFALSYAVMANGICSHALDFDDTHTASILHGSAIFTPLVLALMQELNLDGKKVIEAFVVAWEVSSRIGLASKGSFHKRGFHTTAIVGGFGAVVGAAKMLDLTYEQIVHAIGICGSTSAGINEFLSNGSTSKVIHIANAIHNAINTAYFAKSGMSGPISVFEGRDNIFKTHGIEELCEKELLTKTLGIEWEILNVSIKPYPTCHFAHGFIDCALELRNEINLSDIKEIHCIVDEVPINFICDPIDQKFAPQTAYSAKFSLPFLIALALVDGKINLKSFECLKRDELLEISKKVTYEKAKPNTTGFPKYFPGNMQIQLINGSIINKSVKINKGNPENPLEFYEILDKFKENTNILLSQTQQEELIQAISHIEASNGNVLK